MLVVRETISKLEYTILTIILFASIENTDSYLSVFHGVTGVPVGFHGSIRPVLGR
jgi:hypothetical protein